MVSGILTVSDESQVGRVAIAGAVTAVIAYPLSVLAHEVIHARLAIKHGHHVEGIVVGGGWGSTFVPAAYPAALRHAINSEAEPDQDRWIEASPNDRTASLPPGFWLTPWCATALFGVAAAVVVLGLAVTGLDAVTLKAVLFTVAFLSVFTALGNAIPLKFDGELMTDLPRGLAELKRRRATVFDDQLAAQTTDSRRPEHAAFNSCRDDRQRATAVGTRSSRTRSRRRRSGSVPTVARTAYRTTKRHSLRTGRPSLRPPWALLSVRFVGSTRGVPRANWNALCSEPPGTLNAREYVVGAARSESNPRTEPSVLEPAARIGSALIGPSLGW
jgi:hypothetical protein